MLPSLNRMPDQAWKRWALTLPQSSCKFLIKSLKSLTLKPYKYCTKTVLRWAGRKKYPIIAYTKNSKKRSPPVPLPRRRKRALSLLSIQRPSFFSKLVPGNQQTADQKDCLLLTRLPAEIRNQVWKTAIGNNILHIIPSLVPSKTRPNRYALIDAGIPYRLDYEPCRWDEEFDYPRPGLHNQHLACAIWINPNGELYFSAPRAMMNGDGDLEARFLRWWRRKNRILALLKTCRQVYSEAVHLLYSANSFDFCSLETLRQFPTTILPHRMNSIRNVILRYQFTSCQAGLRAEEKAKWRKACRVLKAMEGLQRLAIDLEDRRTGGTTEPGEILTWLVDVRVDGEFVVRVGWGKDGWERGMAGKLPFTVIRNGALMH